MRIDENENQPTDQIGVTINDNYGDLHQYVYSRLTNASPSMCSSSTNESKPTFCNIYLIVNECLD
jgi:hypothetical protein